MHTHIWYEGNHSHSVLSTCVFVLVTTEVNQCIDVKKQTLLRTECVCG